MDVSVALGGTDAGLAPGGRGLVDQADPAAELLVKRRRVRRGAHGGGDGGGGGGAEPENSADVKKFGAERAAPERSRELQRRDRKRSNG